MILDSNIVIYATQPACGALRTFLSAHESAICVSVVTKVEVLGYHKLQESEKLLLSQMFSSMTEIPITDDIVEKAIALRQSHKLSLGDAFIAATAMITDETLLTNNERDFAAIEGLNLLPLHEAIKDLSL